MKDDLFTWQLIGRSLFFASEEMGIALRDSAYSPNIRERMDHSAAVFDPQGRLVAQAEHIPVHLGSLPWGLARLLDSCKKEGPELEEGCMVASNDPYLTGTHLNDLTVLAPVHHGGRLVAYVVNKAHHSDVGGLAPGSISMQAHTIFEEGTVLEPSYLWRRGRFVRSTLEGFASSSRTPLERRGDMKAQAAANVAGARRVSSLIGRYGLETFDAAVEHRIRHSEALTRKRLTRLKKGVYRASDFLEGPNGEDLVVRVRVSVTSTGVSLDYAGTSAQVDYPLNAVPGVVLSGAHFVLRCLLGSDIPATHGAFSCISMTVPRGSLVNPTRPHPVGGGNVETSQRNADVLFLALSSAAPSLVPAAAGGSMNNVMMGGSTPMGQWAFYETLGVGLGGGPSWDGADGVQANMTNTMNTPIEEMERSFPIRIVRYELRPDSSGAGTWRGGSGIIRIYEVLRGPVTFTIVADRGRHRPWGLAGGGEGAPTEVRVSRGGKGEVIPVKTTMTLNAGDLAEVRTAGGGGFGDPRRRSKAKAHRDIESGLVTRAHGRGSHEAPPG